MLREIFLKKKKIQPNFEKPRPRCPFYGFSHCGGIFMDQDGNQCALITEAYSPCQMEIIAQTPNWNECLFNSEENKTVIEKIMASCKIDPEEFWPKGQSSWRGLLFKDWFDYVMSKKTKRPE